MISENSYTKDWILKKVSETGKHSDPKILEKVIRAFLLLEQIQLEAIPLVFKGGTSLLLHLDPPQRFSIDIDLIISIGQDKLAPIFDKIVTKGQFTSWKDDSDRKHKTNAPVGHYKFYYKSDIDANFGEEPILLDVLFSESYYPTTIDIDIAHRWLLTEDPLTQVKVPNIESILGDKLTAFAPTTIGILYTKNRPVEIIKQLFDVAALFDKAQNFNTVKESYLKIAEEEIKFRELTITWKDALKDTFDAAYTIALRDTTNEHFRHLQTGISNIVNFILTRFTIEEAITCASKAAYLANMLQKDELPGIERYSNPEQIKNIEISNADFNKLNKLKKTNPEAFFYFYKAIEMKNNRYQ
jgi:predicted nucleotidyltransferase component of viral defense system